MEVVIDGKSFTVQEEIVDLILMISQERDSLKGSKDCQADNDSSSKSRGLDKVDKE